MTNENQKEKSKQKQRAIPEHQIIFGFYFKRNSNSILALKFWEEFPSYAFPTSHSALSLAE